MFHFHVSQKKVTTKKMSNNSYCSILIVTSLYPNPIQNKIGEIANNNKNLYYLKNGIFPRKTYHLNKVLTLHIC